MFEVIEDSVPDQLTTCAACQTPRMTHSFDPTHAMYDMPVCTFCHDEGRAPELPALELPPKPARKGKKAVLPPSPASLAPMADEHIAEAVLGPAQQPLNTTEEAAYTPPQFDKRAARANPQAELASRTLARRSLLQFTKRFRPKYDAGWVHKDICRRLERFVKDIEAGLEPRLLICCPPRLGKSELGSRHFPPWVLGQHPDWEIIAASHTTSLSMSFSRYIRDMLRDPAYNAVFPDARLDPSSQSVENWNLTKGGGYLAAGVGSAITGRGAHCLPLTQEIMTSEGPRTLASLIKDIDAAHSVLSYGSGQLAYRSLHAIITRETDHYYQVTCDDGTTFSATGEHPVCVDLGDGSYPPQFCRVDELQAGQHVVSFGRAVTEPKAQCPDAVPGMQQVVLEVTIEAAWGEERPADTHMQQRVHGGDTQSDDDSNSGVSCVRGIHDKEQGGTHSPIGTRGPVPLLLSGMHRSASEYDVHRGEAPSIPSRGACLHPLREAVPSGAERSDDSTHKEPVLQPGVLRRVENWSPYPEGYRSDVATILPRRVSRGPESHAGGEGSVCSVYVSRAGLASQGRGQGEQHTEQSNSCMSELPQAAPQRASTSAIKSVIRIDEALTVADIEVEGAHNFVLPSGHLLLNCLILDDLVKDIEAADSQSQRDSTWEWYISTAHSRLAPGGGVLGIMTWWSEDDWAGRIQQVMATGDGDMFEIVKYPAINDVGDEYILPDDSIMQFPLGAPVPEGAYMTRKHNTALHEARYSLAALLRKKANYIAAGLKRMWDSLYQQNPTPDEGIFFSKEMFVPYTHAPSRRGRTVYQAWDFAITETTQSDWIVGATILQDEFDNLFLLDILRFKSGDGNGIVETIIDYQQQWNADILGFEDGQIWKALTSQFKKRCEERRVYPVYELLVPLTDKMVRANPLKGRMQLGKVHFPTHASWFPEYQRELLRFPAGKHDDQVDATAWCVRLTLSHSAPKIPEAQRVKSWRDKLKALVGLSGSHMAA